MAGPGTPLTRERAEPGRPQQARAHRGLGAALGTLLLGGGGVLAVTLTGGGLVALVLAGSKLLVGPLRSLADRPAPRAVTPAPPTTRPAPFLRLHASAATRRELLPAVALVRRHGQLADQRSAEIGRRHLARFVHLQVDDRCTAVKCSHDVLGTASVGTRSSPNRTCYITLYMPEIRANAREWSMPVHLLLALVLVHEQEHCLRDPDERERPAVEEELRFARLVGDPRLIEYAQTSRRQLTAQGYWR